MSEVVGVASRVEHHKHLTEEARAAKNATIRATTQATKLRRKAMIVRVREISLTRNKLTAVQTEQLERMFLEAKWVRNTALDLEVFDSARHRAVVDAARVRLPDGSFEAREIRVLGGQLAQAVITELAQNLRGLAVLKKKGRRVGRLRFTREVTSINLTQFGTTYRLNHDTARVKIANITGWIHAKGFDQLSDVDEVANAKLVRRPDGYKLLITTYTQPRPNLGRATQAPDEPGTLVGVDMGVKTHLTLSDGTCIDAMFEETDRLRRLRRKLARQRKGSANSRKTKHLIQVESAKITRRKDEAATKIVRELLRNERVFIQDENLASWKTRTGVFRGGKRVHSSIMGRVKMMLAGHDRVTILDRYAPTTATCGRPGCNTVTRHALDQRVYVCPECGYTADRDLHAAENMIRLGMAQTPNRPEQTVTPAEINVRRAAGMDFASIPGIRSWSMKQEAALSSATP